MAAIASACARRNAFKVVGRSGRSSSRGPRFLPLAVSASWGVGAVVESNPAMKPYFLRMSLRSVGLLAAGCCVLGAGACESPPGFPVNPGVELPGAGRPVLVGMLIDSRGEPVANEVTTLNRWTSSHDGGDSSTFGGGLVLTDADGWFRMDSSILDPLILPADGRRAVGLTGSGDRIAYYDARRAFAPGVHYIGDLLLSHSRDAHALRVLSDVDLLGRLDVVMNRGSGARDACLVEMARRGGAAMRERLAGLESAGRRRWPESDSDTALITARNRAERLADPLVMELSPDQPRRVECPVGELPRVSIALVNRDPKGRSIRFCLKSEGRDHGLAVDCEPSDGVRDSFQVFPVHPGGLYLRGDSWEIAPGESAAHEVQLSSYLAINSPGQYRVRLAFRTGTSEMVEGTYGAGGWESVNRLTRGAIFIYSPWITLDVRARD